MMASLILDLGGWSWWRGCHRCQRGTKAGEQGDRGERRAQGWVCRHRNVSRSRVSAVGGRTHIGHGGGMNIFLNSSLFAASVEREREPSAYQSAFQMFRKMNPWWESSESVASLFFAFLNEQAVKVSRLEQSLSIAVVFLGRKLNEMQLMPKKRNLKSRQKWRSARKKDLENIELKTA